jgi:hypothetical protein
MFSGMWVDSRSALKGLGANARCCDFTTAAVNSSGQAYDANGYCNIDPAQGGTSGPCESQWISGFSNSTVMLAVGLLGLIMLLGAKR